ncbi:hypothetical protein P3T76_010685 [Phytophthora citrophthora]|uniref:RxLR effector protein n=1 Tax=Phytophthora citrophthora TaxID=4793 RepID=A0AAD9GBT7_9STRA|nr:hypothetical protein P3T76_010685 [Phytophthora citrophthora]
MRVYQNLLLALAVLVALTSIVSAQNPAVRALRTGTDEERGVFNSLKAELSIFKLNRAARQQMTPEQKLFEKQAKALKKETEAALKLKNKKEEAIKKAEQKLADQVAKSKKKMDALEAKQLKAMKKLSEKEALKKVEALNKQDDSYNLLLVVKKTPEQLEKQFQPGFKTLIKQGIDPTTSENFKYLQNYWFIYYNRYPNKAKIALKTISTAA